MVPKLQRKHLLIAFAFASQWALAFAFAKGFANALADANANALYNADALRDVPRLRALERRVRVLEYDHGRGWSAVPDRGRP